MNDHSTEKEESGSLLSIDTESLIFGSDPPENHEKVRVPQFNCKDEEPTPEEIQKGVITLEKHYSLEHLKRLMSNLSSRVKLTSNILAPISADTFTVHLLQQLACKSFIERGFGWLNLKRYLEEHKHTLQIDQKKYNKIINRLLLKTYQQLASALSDSQQDRIRDIVKPDSEDQLRLTLSVLRNITDLVSKEQSTCFLSLLSTLNSSHSRWFDRNQLENLMNSLKELIGARTDQERGGRLCFYKYQDNIDQLQTTQWTSDMITTLLNSYIQHPSSIIELKRNMEASFPKKKCFLHKGNLKVKIKQMFRFGLQKLEILQDQPQCLSQGSRFRRLDYVGGDKFETLLANEDALEVRLALARFLTKKDDEIDMNILVFTILEVNQYLRKKDNKLLRQNLIITKTKNSMNRAEYEFAGKRKKVLVLKQQKKHVSSLT